MLCYNTPTPYAALVGRHPAGPEGAGHVDLLADLLERLLQERQRQLGDGLLLLGAAACVSPACRFAAAACARGARSRPRCYLG